MHRHARVDASSTIEKREQIGTWVRQVARAMEEQLGKDQQELKMREQKKKAKVVKRIGGIVHENDKNKRTSHVQDEMVKIMHHDEQELLSLWAGWYWDDNKGGGLTRSCAPRQDVKRWSTSVTRCTRVSREKCAHVRR